MTNPRYDPQKAHDYYERHKHLKGRQPGAAEATLKRVGATRVSSAVNRKPVTASEAKSRAQARVVRLTAKVHSLTKALQEAEDALRAKRKEAQQNSDGKTTAKERAASKKYRDTHKSQIAAKAKKDNSKSGGSSSSTSSTSSSSSSSSGPKSVSEMSESELTDRISKIKGAIADAKKQIQSANALAHSFSSSEFISHSGPMTVTTN
jgi:hypothetical protein